MSFKYILYNTESLNCHWFIIYFQLLGFGVLLIQIQLTVHSNVVLIHAAVTRQNKQYVI